MKKINWRDVEEAVDFKLIPPGGYICQITAVEDKPDKEYLDIEFDVAYGEYKDYFMNSAAALGFWQGRLIRSYKPKAMSFFKGFLTALKGSNKQFDEDIISRGDEQHLVGKYIGLTIGHETYWNQEGKERKRVYVDQTRSVQSIRDNDFKIPEEKINDTNRPKPKQEKIDLGNDFYPMLDDDVPF